MKNDVKLVRLQIENIFGVKSVDLELDENGALLIGANQAGKTSVIESIGWMLQLIKDGDALKNGERKGFVRADFGDITVERIVKKSGNPVYKIESKSGEKLTPKELFDNFIDTITFQPALWIDKVVKNKADGIRELYKVSGIDIDEYENKKKELMELRRDIGRDRKRVEGILDALKKPSQDLPDEEINISDLNKEYEELQSKGRAFQDLNSSLEKQSSLLAYKEQTLRDLQLEKERIEKAIKNVIAEKEVIAKGKEVIANKLKTGKDYKYEIQAKLDEIRNIEKTNQEIRTARDYYKANKEYDGLDQQYEDYTDKLKSMETEIKDSLTKCNLPTGFEIIDNDIYLNGVKFDRLSMFQKLDLAMKVGMLISNTGNGRKLKTLCMDISQYDEGNRKKIIELAKQNGIQGIFEIATTNKDSKLNLPTFLIEDGMANNVNGNGKEKKQLELMEEVA